MRKALAAVSLVSLFTLGGCLQKETTHTLYLEPGGAVTWTAIEKDIRSDKEDPVARLAEETGYLVSVSAGAHDTGQALAALGALTHDTLVVRASRPFVVVTDARFTAVEQVIERTLAELRVPGTATVTHAKGTAVLHIHLDLHAGLAADPDGDTPVSALVEDLDHFRIVLTEGRFVGASGFNLSEDGAVAVPIELSDEEVAARAGVIDVWLAWVAR